MRRKSTATARFHRDYSAETLEEIIQHIIWYTYCTEWFKQWRFFFCFFQVELFVELDAWRSVWYVFVILFTLGVKRDKDTCVPSVLCLWEKDHQSSADQLTNSQDKTSNLGNIKVWSLELAKREMKWKKMDAAAYKIISWLVLWLIYPLASSTVFTFS